MATFELPAPPSTPWSRLRWALTDALTVARYNLMHIRYVPEKLLDVTVQPVIFVLLFAYVFGSAISVPGGGSYREYLMAGIFAQTMAFACGITAVGVADDMDLVDRASLEVVVERRIACRRLGGQTIAVQFKEKPEMPRQYRPARFADADITAA